MNDKKFTAMLEDAHKNKVLHLVKEFINETGQAEQFYNYARRNNNELETTAILICS